METKKGFDPDISWFYPNPVVLVTCNKEGGRPNIITIGAVSVVCAKPPMVGIAVSPKRYSHKLILDGERFGVNFPQSEMIEQVRFCGTASGRDVDKAKELGLSYEWGEKMGVPLIRECPVGLECEVVDVLHLGSHDLIIGKIRGVYIDKDFLDERGHLQKERLSPLVVMFGEFFTTKHLEEQ